MEKDTANRSFRRRLVRFAFVLLLLVAAYMVGRQDRMPVISPVPAIPVNLSHLSDLFAGKKDPDTLQRKIQDTIGNQWKNYSIFVKDISSDFEMGINERVVYTAASVSKVAILASVYYQVQQGTVDLDKQITIQPEDIQDYGSGTIRYEGAGNTYSVKTLVRLMMQQSDNTAAYVLSAYIVPLDAIQKLMDSWGLTQTDMVNNKTSNRDMALVLTKIAKGTVANPSHTQEMLAFLQDGAYEDRLPARLPKTATVYHKTGDAVGLLHDVGIVEDGKLRYYIGIFTADVTDEEETKKLMARVSRIVYDFLRR